MVQKRQTLMADFETTTDVNDCRVWAGCAVDIETLKVEFLGIDLDSFIGYLSNKNTVCYFHNLRFDGEFILYWLLKHGYRHNDSRKDRTFQTLITDDGLFYSIEVVFEKLPNKKYKKVVFYDSLKKLPFKVAQIAKAFELPMSKGEIDYNKPRPVGYTPDDNENEYITDDCKIVAGALKKQFDQGLKKMTNASDALHGYKKIVGENFDRWFPCLPVELDADIRRAYKGGFTWLNPKYKNVRGVRGKQYDVNSLYPWVMHSCLLPYGYPRYFEGKPTPGPDYPLFIVHLKCRFKLKENHIPTIQLKNNRRFIETEYLTSSKVKIGCYWEDEPVEMWLTSVDYQLMVDHYNLDDVTFINGYQFKGAVGMFKDYIDYWMHIKETSTGALRQLAKLMLNSLYGKFATNPHARKKIPYLDEEDDVIRYKLDDPEERDPVYTAMGCFITAYAREKTIRSAQANYNRFIYADTDSLKLAGYDEPQGLEVHPTSLGAWKDEGDFSDSKWIRAKTYMLTVDGETKVICAGMPDNVKEKVTYDNFHSGATFDGKLMPKRCSGGVVLVETTFTIK
jgi:hypothetical protein